MILVDDAGGAFPSINHSPWFGVTLADFIMPFFLFSVGVSISLVFKARKFLKSEIKLAAQFCLPSLHVILNSRCFFKTLSLTP